MKIYLARHTQTNFNVAKLCNADPTVDLHLTQSGKEQAQHLEQALSDADYDVIFVSELPRTLATAQIADSKGADILIDPRLNDNKTGYEGKPVQDWLNALSDSDDRWSVKFNNGESLHETFERVSRFLDWLKEQKYSSVLIVTHGFITKCIYAYFNDVSLELADKHDLVQGTFEEYTF